MVLTEKRGHKKHAPVFQQHMQVLGEYRRSRKAAAGWTATHYCSANKNRLRKMNELDKKRV